MDQSTLVGLFFVVYTLYSVLPTMASAAVTVWLVSTHPMLEKPVMEPLRAMTSKIVQSMAQPVAHRRARTWFGLSLC